MKLEIPLLPNMDVGCQWKDGKRSYHVRAAFALFYNLIPLNLG